MPHIEVTMPQTDLRVRESLAKGLTSAFAEATGLEADILRVRFSTYGPGEISSGGKLISDLEAGGPVHIILYTPRLTREKKRLAGESLSRVIREVTGWDEDPVIHIDEHPYDNVVVGGKLLTDSIQELKKARFYYPVEDPVPAG